MVELVEGQTVVCDLTQERTHGRRVGWCYLDGQDIAEALVRAGLARDCPRFSGGRYAAVETASSTRAAVSIVLPAEVGAGAETSAALRAVAPRDGNLRLDRS